jgi:AcrR family transcriptional regulator
MDNPELRAEIVRAAFDLFNRRGYHSATVDDIARRRGMSKRTLYMVFSGKDEIADAVVVAILDDFAARFDAVLAQQLGFRETFRGVFRVAQEVLTSMSPIFLEDLERYLPSVFQRILAFRAEHMRRLANVLAAAQSAGEVRPDVRTGLVIDILLAAVQETGRPEWLHAAGIGFPELIDTVERLFLYGVCCAPSGSEASANV